MESPPRQRSTHAQRPLPLPSLGSRRATIHVTADGRLLQHQVRAYKLGPRTKENAQKRACRRVRRIGHHSERAAWQSKFGGVGLHDDYRIAREALAKVGGPDRMQLDGDHTCAAVDEMPGQRAFAGADVKYEVRRPDTGVSDDARGPSVGQRVPTPGLRRGHDAP